MASRSNYLELDPQASLKPQSLSGAAAGSGVDLQGAESALIVIDNGAATTAATVQIQESSDNATFTVVADSDLIAPSGYASNASGVLQTANSVVKIAYVGAQRYVRVNVLTGASAGWLVRRLSAVICATRADASR